MIITTGSYTFNLGTEELGSSKGEMFLEYEHLPLLPSSPEWELDDHEMKRLQATQGKMRSKKWNREEIGDFVRKLGFMDKDKGGDKIKHFLHLNQVS